MSFSLLKHWRIEGMGKWFKETSGIIMRLEKIIREDWRYGSSGTVPALQV
jgi:hypothetical protein